MRKIGLIAAAAVLFVTPALAGSVTATVAAVDTKHRAVILDDKTIMLVADEVDLAAVKVGMKVTVEANVDEDGYSRATAITPAN